MGCAGGDVVSLPASTCNVGNGAGLAGGCSSANRLYYILEQYTSGNIKSMNKPCMYNPCKRRQRQKPDTSWHKFTVLHDQAYCHIPS